MLFHQTPLEGARLIELEKRGDDRGFFARFFCEREFEKAGLVNKFVQVNNSLSAKRGTLRGMHYQLAPAAEVKIVRCLRGALYDAIVDHAAQFADIRQVVRRRAHARKPPDDVRSARLCACDPDARGRHGGALPRERFLRARTGAWASLERSALRMWNGRSSLRRFPPRTRRGRISIRPIIWIRRIVECAFARECVERFPLHPHVAQPGKDSDT